MKKILGLSAIASLALSSSLYANSVAETFENLKVNGEIKAIYSDSNFLGATDSESISAIGGNLGIITEDYNGFSVGATFQASSVLGDDFNATTAGPQIDQFDASGAVLSEAYLQYKISNTNFKLGRQYIYTPLVSSALEGKSSESLLKDSFRAYLVTNTDIPNTSVTLGYVDRYQPKVDANSNGVGEFDDFKDGAYTIYVKNNSIENLTLQAQYLDVDSSTAGNDRNSLYFQADYQLGSQTISAQYLKSENASEDGQLFGLKATGPLGIWKFGYVVAFNASTDDTGAAYLGEGAGTTDTAFTALPVHGGGVPARNDNNTLVGALVAPVGPTTIIGYAGKSMSDATTGFGALGDVTGTGAMFIYPIAKDLVLKANYEHVTVEAQAEDTDTARIYLSFKF